LVLAGLPPLPLAIYPEQTAQTAVLTALMALAVALVVVVMLGLLVVQVAAVGGWPQEARHNNRGQVLAVSATLVALVRI
jgi:hypothetical protein